MSDGRKTARGSGAVMRRPAACAMVAVLAACAGADESNTGSAVEVSDSAGVRLVRNDSITIPGWLVEELRIGVVEGDEQYQFFRVASVATSRTGDIYVANGGSTTVRVFTPEGAFLREFGGKGQGPGQIEGLGAARIAGDTVVVTDFYSGVSLFSTDGRYLTEWPRMQTGPEGGYGLTPLGRTGGRWIARYSPPTPLPSQSGLWIRTERYHVWNPVDGSVGSEVVTFPGPALILRLQAEGRGEAGAGPLFDPVPSAAIDTLGHVYVTAGDDYRIDVVETSGRLVRRVSRAYAERPVDEAMVERYKSLVTDHYLQLGRSAAVEADRDRNIEERTSSIRSTHLPPTGSLLVAPDGAFWVQRTDLEDDPAQREFQRSYGSVDERPRTTWEVFDARGLYVTTVEIPAVFQPMAVEERSVLGVLRDDLDVEYVVRYRLEI